MDLSLDDVCEFINGGAWSDDEYVDAGIRVVKVTNMQNGTVTDEALDHLPSSKYEKYKRHELRLNDLVVATVGSHPNQPGSVVGRTSRIPASFAGAFLNQNAVCLRVKRPDLVDQRFLSFLSETVLFKHHIESRARGSANQVRMAIGDLRQFNFSYPPLPTQRKIAAVLAAYDDLIEANRRRIALLERMAEELYREWFVRLRFPGHAKTKITKGLPAGWEIRPFSAVVAIDPIERIDKEEERPFAAMDDLSESSMYFTPSERRRGNVGPKFRNRDVLFPRITPSVENGKRGLVLTLAEGEVAQGSTEFIVMREKVITSEHIYFLSCSEGFRTNAELSMTGASGRQRVQDQCFDNFLVKLPPEPLRQRFTDVVRPMVEQIRILSRQSEHLQRTRDLLLPRLISGKLPIEDLAIAFPPSMAESKETKPA